MFFVLTSKSTFVQKRTISQFIKIFQLKSAKSNYHAKNTLITLFFIYFFQISISQVTPSDHTHNYMKIQSMFRLYKMWLTRFPQVNSWKFAYQIALIILWNTSGTSNNCDSLINYISSIQDRYQAYFVQTPLRMVGISGLKS